MRESRALPLDQEARLTQESIFSNMNLMLIPKGGNRLTGEFPRSAIDEEKKLCRMYSMETKEEKEKNEIKTGGFPRLMTDE